LRYGFAWHRVNPGPDVFDWTYCDSLVAEANRLGIGLVIDLVHYGTPTWLPRSFLDPEYPASIASYAGAVADRFGRDIAGITPLNEPLVTASFTGQRGVWPPFAHGEAGWSKVVVAVADGIQQSIHAIRSAAHPPAIVHVEATNIWITRDHGLAGAVELAEQQKYLPTDLVFGRVDQGHSLFDWLVRHGIPETDLIRMTRLRTQPDIIGINYYPELSPRELIRTEHGSVGVVFNAWTDGLAAVTRDFHDRYGLPLMITETAVEGPDEHRIAWLVAAAREVNSLRRQGVPVTGIIWWGLTDFVDWSWATGDKVIEEFYIEDGGGPRPVTPPRRADGIEAFFRRMGLWRLTASDGHVHRVATPLIEAFSTLAADT
jgi:beta-glucosidase/6-phospho-beta-glucosidase/beta-galactosidase